MLAALLWFTFDLGDPLAVSNLDAQKVQIIRLYPDELIINWDYYQAHVLEIEGKIECLTATYCNFIPNSALPKIVWINIAMLDFDTKRDILRTCRVSCDAIVYGQVGLANLTAWKVWAIDP